MIQPGQTGFWHWFFMGDLLGDTWAGCRWLFHKLAWLLRTIWSWRPRRSGALRLEGEDGLEPQLGHDVSGESVAVEDLP